MGDNDDRAPLPDDLSSTTDAMRRSPMCVKCSSALMMCECTGGQAHGEDVAFMCSDPLPADATMRQHLGRFVALVEAHPMMQGQIQIRQFVNDYLAKGLEQTLREKKSLVQEMVEAYQAHDSYEELIATLKEDRATVDEGCEDAIENIFKGAWYYVSKLQVILLMNAFQVSDKERFPQSDAGLATVFDVLNTVHVTYGLASKALPFSLELRNES